MTEPLHSADDLRVVEGICTCPIVLDRGQPRLLRLSAECGLATHRILARKLEEQQR